MDIFKPPVAPKVSVKLSNAEYIEAGKKFECSECGQKFVSERAKTIHETTMHDSNQDDFEKCPKCEKTFRSSRALATHLKVYHESGNVRNWSYLF
jgi:uncharacterized protein with PIN domain